MNSKIDVVITMGGLGSRFRKAGYRVPKYMIEAKGKTLFEWSLISLEGYREDVNQYVFIAMADEENDVKGFIESKCEELGIENYHVILLDYLTDGQATTAMKAAAFWNMDNALLIYNIDTYVEAGEMNSAELKGDGFIPCFQAEGDHWSFVRLDQTRELVNGEKYVAPLYDYLLSKGGEIFISDINPDKVHVLGTPEELKTFLEN